MNPIFQKIICLSIVFITVISHEECDHDKKQKEFEEILKQYPNDPNLKRRSLQSIDSNFLSGNVMPIRITYNVDLLYKTQITNGIEKEKILSVIDIIVRFVTNFIKVRPNPSKNMPQQQKCLDIIFPQDDYDNGIESSDLHVYFKFERNSNNNNIATATICSYQQIGSKVRPNFGVINFNFANLKDFTTNTRQFSLVLMTGIHEFIHLLGFSGDILQGKKFPQFKTEIGLREYFYQRNSKDILKSPNILATAKKYFGCDFLQGVPLEKGGSHWDNIIFRNEMMAPAESNSGSSLSVFTVALLKDLNLWEDINENLTEPYFWGKNQGCGFPENACKGNTNYVEFSSTEQKVCSFKYDGSSYPQKIEETSSCFFRAIFSNRKCSSSEKQYDPSILQKNNLQILNHESKCFNSNIQQHVDQQNYFNHETLCLLNKCENNQNGETIIKVILPNDSESIICGPKDQNIQKIVHQNGKNIGTINCPSNYERFCGIKRCKDDCHFNGICVRGTCYCRPGYEGENCKDPCPNRECKPKCKEGTYANPNNTCQTSCPIGFYGNISTKKCELCDFSCSKCKGPNSNDCLACQFLTKLVGNMCVGDDCARGEYYNQTTQLCDKCSLGCADCTSKADCNTCESGFKKVHNTCVNSHINQYPKTETNIKKNQCPPGKFLDPLFEQCFFCMFGCADCTSKADCNTCESGFKKVHNTCVNSHMNQYPKTETNIKINQCPPGEFFDTFINNCFPCLPGCLKCSQFAKCTVCDTGFRLLGNWCRKFL